mmetsp:Transcript_52440/g.157320  ORF Transcript_52440/g.157320 Transcript_52440/m.157320 type:complete len:178 (-) Transcript_52440:265-798(-)
MRCHILVVAALALTLEANASGEIDKDASHLRRKHAKSPLIRHGRKLLQVLKSLSVESLGGGFDYFGKGFCLDENGRSYSYLMVSDGFSKTGLGECAKSCPPQDGDGGVLRGVQHESTSNHGTVYNCHCLYDSTYDKGAGTGPVKGSDVESNRVHEDYSYLVNCYIYTGNPSSDGVKH